ncbi:MAG TPA: hypothetical protein QF813_08590 [Alphaproteobacteria bacterium]|jgi:hypothetical protein|nr:hypothetical protein [Alphaproteobacteria bacterium]|tara:strand:- start:475 stop:801 length:327 start_codon:yes stop_codon:yes gene_type:complete
MITRNHRNQIVRSTRHINSRISAELLVGDGWEGVAYAELRRLSLEVGAYHSQLEGKPGHEETRQAVEALKLSYKAIDEAYGDGADPDSDSGANTAMKQSALISPKALL